MYRAIVTSHGTPHIKYRSDRKSNLTQIGVWIQKINIDPEIDVLIIEKLEPPTTSEIDEHFRLAHLHSGPPWLMSILKNAYSIEVVHTKSHQLAGWGHDHEKWVQL